MTCKPEQDVRQQALDRTGRWTTSEASWWVRGLRVLTWPVVAFLRWRVRRSIERELGKFQLVDSGPRERDLAPHSIQHRCRDRRTRARRLEFKLARRRNRYQ